MDRYGHIFRETDALGCKITHHFTRPDMFLVGDDVGGNISMTDDIHHSDHLLLWPKGTTPQDKVSTRDKHFTLMDLATMSGEPVIFIIILLGKQPSSLVEIVINNSTKMVGKEGGEIFLNNCGEVKLYPGGSTCNFQGKIVPYFI